MGTRGWQKNNFVVIIKHSDSGSKTNWTPRLKLACERSEKYKQKRKMKIESIDDNGKITSTKKCECPFLLRGVKLPNSEN